MLKTIAKIWLNRLIRKEKKKRHDIFQLSSVRSLLFVELTKFGDVVNILPAIQSFHDAFPKATLAVAFDSRFAEIFNHLEFPVKIIPFTNTRKLNGFLNSLSKTKEERCDVAISMSPGARNGILTLDTHAKAKIGYFAVLDSATPFLHETIVEGFGIELKHKATYGRENITLRAKKICSAIGIPWHDKITFTIQRSLKENVKKQLGLAPISPEKPVVIIHPFAGWKYREWKLSHFLSVARELAGKGSADVILIGMPDELEKVTREKPLPGGVKIFNAESIPNLLALYSMASLYIGNDSGPLHLASMAGVPCVGLFGPAPPELTAPAAGGNIHCYHRVECSPCDQLKCLHPEHPCMEYVASAEVLDAARKLLRIPVNAS
jgi:ADP-heptose:LPS heptosyltransferase